MPNKDKDKNVQLRVSPDLKQVYINGALGGFNDCEFRLMLFSETLEPKGELIDEVKIVREINYDVIMSPKTVIELYSWLGEHIEKFESQQKEKSEDK